MILFSSTCTRCSRWRRQSGACMSGASLPEWTWLPSSSRRRINGWKLPIPNTRRYWCLRIFVPPWRYMMQADYGNVKQVTVRISDWSLWTEQMEALANLDPEARDRIIEAWRIEVRRKQLNLSVVT